MLFLMMTASPNPFLEVLGRFHPLLLHFPIAFVLAAAVIELVRWLAGRRDTMSGSSSFCMWAGLVMGGLATWAGWLLADHQALAGSDIFWHRWTGVAAMGLLVLAAFAWILRKWKGRDWLAPHVVLLLLSAIMICVSGHIGAEMVWGDDWLFEPLSKDQAKATTKPDIEAQTTEASTTAGDSTSSAKAAVSPSEVVVPSPPASGGKQDATVTWAMIEPIFEAHCAKCHGPKRQKGDLQLVPWDAIFEFGPADWAIRPGNVKESWVHERIILPPDHEDAMPPEGKADPLTADQIALINQWIEQGALGPHGQAPKLTGAHAW